MILYGKPVAEAIRKDYFENFGQWQEPRTLTVIADETSDRNYIKAIKNAAVEWGVDIRTVKDEREAREMYAERVIDIRKEPKTMQRCYTNGCYSMDGQSPDALLGMYKGLTTAFTPCTPEAIMDMLDYYNISVEGKNVVILGRGGRVGKPLALQMLQQNATVTVCHSYTPATVINDYTLKADIVVCATGVSGLLKRYDLTYGATVANVGGDYDETTGHEGINLIPFKGGVGCVTAAVLMRHVRL